MALGKNHKGLLRCKTGEGWTSWALVTTGTRIVYELGACVALHRTSPDLQCVASPSCSLGAVRRVKITLVKLVLKLVTGTKQVLKLCNLIFLGFKLWQ